MNPADNCSVLLESGWLCGAAVMDGDYCDEHYDTWSLPRQDEDDEPVRTRCHHIYSGLQPGVDARCVMPALNNGRCEHHQQRSDACFASDAAAKQGPSRIMRLTGHPLPAPIA